MIITLHDTDQFKHGNDKVTRIRVINISRLPHNSTSMIYCAMLTDNKTSIARNIQTDEWISGNKGVFVAMQEAGIISNHKHYKELF